MNRLSWTVLTTTALALVLVVAACTKPQVAGPALSASSEPAAQALASDPPYAYTLIIGTAYESQGHDHVAQNEATNFAYNSDPPTSGPHKEIFSDVFDSALPLPKPVQVNLLEHANVLLQYNCICPDIADELHRIAYKYDRDWIRPNQTEPLPLEAQDAEYGGFAVVVAPYPGMSHEIAMTSWRHVGTLDSLDLVKINDFIHAYLHNVSNTEP